MHNTPREEGEGLYAADIQRAVEELNAKEAEKPRQERREFLALGNAESSIFWTVNTQGGFTHWYVIAGDVTGRWYLAAPIRLNGFGLKLEKRRIFMTDEMRNDRLEQQDSLSGMVDDALNRLNASVASLSHPDSPAEVVNRTQRQFTLAFARVIINCTEEAGHLALTVYEMHEARPHTFDQSNGMHIRIGRDPNRNDVVCPSSNVSRLQCELRREANQWLARDCDSFNGTRLNGQPLPTEWTPT